MTDSLDSLVDDIVLQILQALPVRTLLSLRRASRRYYFLSKLRCVWYTRYRAEVLAQNLPPPGPPIPLAMLSAAELERRTLRALYLDRAWPRLAARTLVSSKHHGPRARVDQVVFIPGGTDVLTVQGDTVVHWLVVSWPGFAQGLKHVGTWTPVEGVSCRIVKNGDIPGVVAVGPRASLRSHRFAKVVSTSLKAPFVTLRDYTRVPGVVVGVWRHVLLLDTTRDPGGGGVKLLNWRARTTGTALLPRLPDVFGSFLDFVVFSGHLLIVWEHCVSVFSVPHIPANGQVVAEHKRVFMFQEMVCRPVAFTTCVAQRVGPLDLDVDAGLDQDGIDWDDQCKRYPPTPGVSPTLTIAARSRRRAESISMVMLVPLADDQDRDKVVDTTTFPYRLTYLPPHLPTMWPSPCEVMREPGPRACTTLCLGSSGRGLFVVGRELRLVSPGLLIIPPYEMQFGPVFETGEALYALDRYRQRDVDRFHLGSLTSVWGNGDVSGDRVDFDEGMGRFVVANERGFDVVQLE